jgi:hypothetical protein
MCRMQCILLHRHTLPFRLLLLLMFECCTTGHVGSSGQGVTESLCTVALSSEQLQMCDCMSAPQPWLVAKAYGPAVDRVQMMCCYA